jgi:uncharacterized protein (TIGR00251 family)
VTRPAPDGVTLTVKVVPRAAQPSLTVDEDGTLRARLHSPPVEGAANDELVAVLAAAFGLPRRAVAIVGGAQARTKRVRLEGIDAPRAAAVVAGLSGRGSRRGRTPRR